MVTYGGEQSLDRYLALSARGVPFNIAHATGNFVIALAAGPALVRMISRFRTRLEFQWRPAGAISLLLVALVAAGAAGGAGSSEAAAGAKVPASSWLARAQNDDGGFSATQGQTSSPAMTGWAMLGLEAAGTNPLDLREGGETPVSYLRSEMSRLRSVGDLERTILALAGAGVDPHRFAGSDLVAQLHKRLDRDGSVDGQVNLTAFYALAMRAAGAGTGSLKRPAAWLRGAQNADGGWGIQPQAPSEADSTGATLQGLAAAGARGRASARGAAWLRRAQRSSGGWALAGTGVVNSQSTAWAVQGLAAIGGAAHSIHNALGYLGHLRAPDGHYRYSASSDQTPIWVTAQVLLAVERRPFPLAAVPRAPTRNRGADARSGAGGGEGSSAGAASPAQPTGSAPATGGGQSVASAPPASGTGSGPDTPTQSPATGGGNASAPAGGGSAAIPAGGASAATAGAEPGASAPDASPGADPVPVSVAYESGGSSGGGGATQRRGRGDRGARGLRRGGAGLVPPPHPVTPCGSILASALADGRRDSDPHAPHPQGLPARRGRARDARRALRARPLGPQPQPHQPVALPGARARGAGAPQGGGRA